MLLLNYTKIVKGREKNGKKEEKKMERTIFGIIAVVLFAGILIGCGSAIATISTETERATSAENKASIEAEKKETSSNEATASTNMDTQGTNNETQKISKSIVNACTRDAKSRFEEWYIANYKSYFDLGLYDSSNLRTQVTENTVSVAFEMEIGMLAPSQPTFSVTASYTVENGSASLFSFDVR